MTCLFSICSGPVSDAAPVLEKDDMEPENKRRKTDDGEKSWEISVYLMLHSWHLRAQFYLS